MADDDTFLDVMQADIAAVLRGMPALAHATVIADDEGDLDSKVERSLASRKESTSGKRGLVIIVMRPEITDAETNLPGPPMEVKTIIQVIEQVMYNRDPANGSGKTSSQAAISTLSALHLRSIGSRLLFARKTPITTLPVIQGHLSRAVTLFAKSDGLITAKPPGVTTVWVNGDTELQLSAGGYDVHWTSDGTFPARTSATLYTAPIAGLTSGTIVRACAWSDELGPGDLLEHIVT